MFGTMFFFGALTLNFIGWFPSFCVRMTIFSKEQAAFALGLSALFQVSLRALSVPFRISSNHFLRFSCCAFLAFAPIMAMLLWMGLKPYLGYVGYAYLPLAECLFIPSMYSLPSEFGLELSSNTASKMMLGYAFGEALLTSCTGYLMEIHPMSLFGVLFVLAILLGGSGWKVLALMEGEKEEMEGGIKGEMKEELKEEKNESVETLP